MRDPNGLIVEHLPANIYYIANRLDDVEYLFDGETFELLEAAKVFDTETLNYIPSWSEKLACIDAIEHFEKAKRT